MMVARVIGKLETVARSEEEEKNECGRTKFFR
jgi:hypothetical protein